MLCLLLGFECLVGFCLLVSSLCCCGGCLCLCLLLGLLLVYLLAGGVVCVGGDFGFLGCWVCVYLLDLCWFSCVGLVVCMLFG